MPEPRVVIVTFPSTQILDVTCPLEVFSTTGRLAPNARYRTEVVSARGGPVTATCGLSIATSALAGVRAPIDTLLVSGGEGARAAVEDEVLLHHVRRLATTARRVTSVCTGSFVLAAAGLLSGRRATTHWAWCDTLASAYPDITVEPDSIYVRDGNVWTAAGVTSGIDLALALVAEDRGHALAAEVARQLVVYLRRSGGQSQFSAPLAAQSNAQSNARAHARSTQSTGELQHLLAWIVDNLARDLTVPALAAKVHLSERQFTRVFKAAVGATPAEHVEAYA